MPPLSPQPLPRLRPQVYDVAVSGSYAYVTRFLSDSLTVVDVSNQASPTIVGSVSSSSVMDGVRPGPGRALHVLP